MKRDITNIIRFFMDECLPPVIRDNKYFMHPVFYYCFKGNQIYEAMHFKDLINEMTDEEYISYYQNIQCIGNDRPTDLNKKSVDFIVKSIRPDINTVLDVGSGRGYMSSLLSEKGYVVTACDLFESGNASSTHKYVKALVDNLPFQDKSFDMVMCNHTLEHIKDLPKAISELKRVAKKQLIITVPCQRYFYYTLDLHINFFPTRKSLIDTIAIDNFVCENMGGDFVFVGNIE